MESQALHTDKPSLQLPGDKIQPPANLQRQAVKELSASQPRVAENPQSKQKEVAPKRDAGQFKTETSGATKDNLPTEVKQSIDKSKAVHISEQSEAQSGDIVVQRDGTIKQYLNMKPPSEKSQDLNVVIESDPTGSGKLSDKQAATLKGILDYAISKNKPVKDETSPKPNQEPVKPVSQDQQTPDQQSNQDTTPSPEVNPKSNTNPQIPKYQPSYNPGSSNDTQPSSRSTDLQAQRPSSPGSDTNYGAQPTHLDWTKYKLPDLLALWLDADPNMFQQLMPDLYKLIVGKDGKIDRAKLDKLCKEHNPMIEKYKKQIPLLNEAFHVKANNSNQNSVSGEAVSARGKTLASNASNVASEMNTVYTCAAGVSKAIERTLGVTIYGNANDMRDSLPKYGFSQDNSGQLKVGQVVHVSWTPETWAQERARFGQNCANIGDIAIIGKGADGKLYAYNDHAEPLDTYLKKSRYDWNTLKVFDPPSSNA